MENVVLLTVVSAEGKNFDTSKQMAFIVSRIGEIQANQNAKDSSDVTEAGDASNQMSSWSIQGTGDKLYWTLMLNTAGDREVCIYRDSTHKLLVAKGTKAGDGVVNCYPVNESGIFVRVTVAYTAADADVANTIQFAASYEDFTDIQLNGESQLDYTEANGKKHVYTVSETVAEIVAAINSTEETVSSVTGTLSTAQITSGNTTPVAAITAPGADYYIQILGGAISYDYDTAAYSVNTTIDLVNTTTGTILANASTAISGTSDKVTRFIPVAGVVKANEGISLKVNTGDPTVASGAAGTCKYTILYAIYHI